MSSLIYCPDCESAVNEVAWGGEIGDYECRDCGCEFEKRKDDDGNLVTEVKS
jgi:hypothetical protein